MKKIGLCVGMFSFMFFSCVQKEEKTPDTIETNNTTVEKETVIVHDTVKEPVEEKGTSVKVSGDGLDVDSKDVDVEIKK